MTNTDNVNHTTDQERSFFGRSKSGLILIVIMIFALGIGFRLMRLTSPPLDVHAWRWLRSAITTRGMYYEMASDVDQDLKNNAISISSAYPFFEPPLTEKLVALSYLAAGGEYLWMSRIWTTLFWTIGGIAAFLLAKQITSTDGAVVTLAYFMLLPFANTETRAFLPESLMVMFIMLALYSAYKWVDTISWKWAISTGILVGMAILTKVFAIFPLGSALIFLCIQTFGFKNSLKNRQVWTVGLLAILIPATFYVFPDTSVGGNYLETWSLPFLGRLFEIDFYISWIHTINGFFNLALVLIAIASVSILEKRWRALLFGLWVGYFLFGMTFPTLIWSHSYYNLFLVGIVALSLAPAGALLLKKISKEGIFWQILILGTGVIAVAFSVFLSRKAIVANDYSSEAQKWETLGAIIIGDKAIGLTDDYNMRLAYFGNKVVKQYPHYYDWVMANYSENEFDISAENQEYFDQKVSGMEYFVITLFDEFDSQPYLKNILYAQYAIFDQSDWYIVFDLNTPLDKNP